MIPRRTLVGLVFLLNLLFAHVLQAQSRSQTISGVVTDGQRRPIAGAVVKLKNLITLNIRSFITQSGGEYRFVGLHPDVDYSVRAPHGNRWSRRRAVTQFDNRASVRVDLPIISVRKAR